MKLEIDILDSDYKKIQQFAKGNTCYSVTERMYQAIKNGIPIKETKGEKQ